MWPSLFAHGLRTVRLALKATHPVPTNVCEPPASSNDPAEKLLGGTVLRLRTGPGTCQNRRSEIVFTRTHKMIISWLHRHFNQNQPSLIIGILKIFTRLGSKGLWLLKYLASLGIFRRRNCYRPWRHFQK